MKKAFLLPVFFLIALACKSQDKIVTNGGKEIKAKITESNSDQVKFHIFDINNKQIFSITQKIRKFNKQNIPIEKQVFSIPRREVFMINYENGKSEFFKEKIPEEVVKNVLNFIDVNDQPEAYKMYRAGYKRFSLSRGLVGAGGGILAFGTIALLVNSTNGKNNKTDLGASYIYIGTGTLFLAAGLPLYFTAKKKMNDAFDLYRKSAKTSMNNYSLDYGITQNGLGLNLKF